MHDSTTQRYTIRIRNEISESANVPHFPCKFYVEMNEKDLNSSKQLSVEFDTFEPMRGYTSLRYLHLISDLSFMRNPSATQDKSSCKSIKKEFLAKNNLHFISFISFSTKEIIVLRRKSCKIQNTVFSFVSVMNNCKV